MKKAFLSILMVLCCLIASAQSKSVEFRISPTGTFLSDDGKDYIIYPVEGTAHELYQMVCTNVGKVYNSAKDVMSTVEDKSVAIRAFSDNLIISEIMLGIKFYYSFYYNLLFEFKDGRIKITAPIIGEMNGDGKRSTFYKKSQKFFDKQGNVKKSRAEEKTTIENEFNGIISKLLSIDNKSSDNDW